MNHATTPEIPADATVHEAGAHAGGQQHPIGVYLKVWGYLFVLSAMSYMVDYFQVQGIMRWVLIITFMLLKAGLIVAIFMHMAWERMALVYAILVPPLCLTTLVALMLIESDYTLWTRILFLDWGG
ncbi:cytochrome C oxidase subunit IV family protein [Sphingomonas cavernae]|uniref:Cytochrome C oxidase subunit IV n=1 Tax=Sphingomonas cavernae TaxID=2320861 RepID=A0A418W6X0_9SPHN|nr:cytochrome C oxidase subunit IV family protein [Sphingomonas cavernae]RJF85786.1 cytochrome C oxidase subunit IV [Sphingomonas cavernae]